MSKSCITGIYYFWDVIQSRIRCKEYIVFLFQSGQRCLYAWVAFKHKEKLHQCVLFTYLFTFNCSTELTVTKSWGREANGSWNGMCGYIQRGECDIGVTPMFITKNRMHFLHYVQSTLDSS